MNIGKRITFYRNLKGYTVNKLATLSGISQSYLRDVELGNKNPTIETLSYLCDSLDLSLRDFFDDETRMNFESDPLIRKIHKLNINQRKALFSFLDTMIK